MSTHGLAHDDEEIPKSGGIAPSMYLFMIVSAIIIFMQGYFVVAASGDAHVWRPTPRRSNSRP